MNEKAKRKLGVCLRWLEQVMAICEGMQCEEETMRLLEDAKKLLQAAKNA